MIITSRRRLVSGGLAAAGAPLLAAAAQAGPRSLRAVDTQPPDYPTVQGLQFMARHISRATSNALNLRVFSSGQLGEERDSIEQVKRGVIDIARINASLLSETHQALQAFQAPYVLKSDEHLQRIIDGEVGQSLLNGLGNSSHLALTFYDSGARHIYNRIRPILKLADLAGLRIRVQQSSLAADVIRVFGGTPIPLPFSQVLPALTAGLIDGAENNWPSYVTSNHHEAAAYISETGHIRPPEVILVSRSSWDSLNGNERRVLQEAADLSRLFVRRVWMKWTEITRAQAVEAGVDIAAAFDRTAFVTAGDQLSSTLRATDIVSSALDQFVALETP